MNLYGEVVVTMLVILDSSRNANLFVGRIEPGPEAMK
ncbi:MAG: hypothetical protein JW384_02133 [Nitrosomonadaceae bacterium]|nr:hypothetical protein [Nitrosomonadaceae bacterium]